MGLLRKPAFLAAAAMSMIVALYFALVASRALAFIRTDDPVAKALGFALIVLPALGAWWLANEWRFGTTVQRMAKILEEQGRLPVQAGEVDEFGRPTEEARAENFELARRGVELEPTSWVAWFHVAYAYEASKDRAMARKSLRYAAELFREATKAKGQSASDVM